VFANPAHPYTQGLLGSIPRIDPERRYARYAIPGAVPSATTEIAGCAFRARCAHALPGVCDRIEPAVVTVGPEHAAACHLHGDAAGSADASGTIAPRFGASVARDDRTERATSDEVVLDVRDVEVHYPVHGGLLQRRIGTVRAVDGVSLALRRGETVGLVGESGCGKTSLAHALVRLHAPTSGRVGLRLRGGQAIDVAAAEAKDLRTVHRTVRMVFQDPYGSLDPRLPVRDVIGESIELLTAATRRERDARVDELLATVGLPVDVATRYVHAFSGGQRQRIGIARALATDPEVLIADEPVSALDVSVQAQVLNLLERLATERELTMLFVSHDLSVVSSLCDRVIVMYAGEIVEEAPSVRLYRRPRHPYTEALLAAVPVPDPRLARGERTHLQGRVPDPAERPAGCTFAPRCAFATDRCREERPALRDLGDGSRVACHHAEDLDLTGAPVRA
jgi:peptide/nickel transport system ATP-binding protein